MGLKSLTVLKSPQAMRIARKEVTESLLSLEDVLTNSGYEKDKVDLWLHIVTLALIR